MGIENEAFALMGYGDTWRANRRMFHQEFNSSKVTNYLQEQIKYTKSVAELSDNFMLITNSASFMLRLIKNDPAAFVQHLSFLNSGIILEVSADDKPTAH